MEVMIREFDSDDCFFGGARVNVRPHVLCYAWKCQVMPEFQQNNYICQQGPNRRPCCGWI